MNRSDLDNIGGMVIWPSNAEFESYRAVWNKAAVGTPHVIIVPESVEDASMAVRYAAEMNKSVCIRGGGHHFAGLAVQEDAVMIHMGGMKTVHVDSEKLIARVGAGATIGELDEATQPYGLAVPSGTSSGTGIAGLTLGGGFGHLRRQYGLTCDALVGATMVLANGEVVHLSKDENPRLFWGIRGGGGNFGIVTEFEFQLYPAGPDVAVLDVFYDLSDLPRIMTELQDAAHKTPNFISFHLLISPFSPQSKYPEGLHGKWVVRILGMANADVEVGMANLEPFRNLATPLLDESRVTSYLGLQSSLDANFPDGVFYDGTSVFLDRLTPALIETIETLLRRPQPVSLQLWPLGGQLSQVSHDATAFHARDAEWVVFVNAAGSERGKLEQRARWMRHAISEIGKHTQQPTFYSNAVGPDELTWALLARNIYGPNFKTLLALKQQVDPENRFRHNVNLTF